MRTVHLSNYLRELVADVAAQGKIAKIEGNPVQVAAVALLSGSIAVAEAMAGDIKLLAGNAKITAQAMARPMLETAAKHGVGLIIGKLFPPQR